ncbi:MAG: hypothetical protein SFX74_10265 [Fimbriimonadaceae bacterium]|nr:hypothetical protein [Fimbriimonadaceae bacterium]
MPQPTTPAAPPDALSDPLRGAQYIWVDAPLTRNAFVVFRLRMDLAEVVPAELHLFADTRYRLIVNGRFVATGPGRFVTQFPEYDSHPIAEYLVIGPNEITVEVNFFGASSFQTMPDGRPGFIAALTGLASGPVLTPGPWTAHLGLGWHHDAPAYSFAQGPVEIRDLRVAETPVPVRVLAADECPWGELKAFSGTKLPFDRIEPAKLHRSGGLCGPATWVGFMAENSEMNRADGVESPSRPWVKFRTWLWSPRGQTTAIDCFWSVLHFRGETLRPQTNRDRGNHGTVTLDLESGWNELYGEVEVMTEFWAYLLGASAESGLRFSARPEAACAAAIQVSPVGDREAHSAPATCELPIGWREVDGDLARVTPARVMGWLKPVDDAVGELGDATHAGWTFTFTGEFHGHVSFEVESTAPAIIDVATDDWLRDDGTVALYRSNPFVDSVDRFLVPPGRHALSLFHPRGGKAVQIVARAEDGSEVAIRDVHIKNRLIWADCQPVFESSDALVLWAHRVSMDTLRYSTDDAYADCPWRERGSYIGDGLVNLHLNLQLTADLRTARRTFLTFARAQRADGQLPGCAPAWLRKPHEDFTLLWLVAAHDYWAYTGDTAFVREVWPTIGRIWDSPTWNGSNGADSNGDVHESGLWSLNRHRAFFDWGCLESERRGTAHAGINVLRVVAARRTAALARTIGADASRWEAEAHQTEAALFATLWDDTAGRLRPYLDADTPGLHFNVLALWGSVGSPAHHDRMLAAIEPAIRANREKGTSSAQFAGHLELFFLSFLLPALAEATHRQLASGQDRSEGGKWTELAETVIRDHYGFLREIGDDTLPECFGRVKDGVGSRCHSWSGAAGIYAIRHLLGLQLETPGDPDAFVVRPVPTSIGRLAAEVPHRHGPIRIVREGERVTWEAPSNVRIRRA